MVGACRRRTHDFFFSIDKAFDEKKIKYLQKNKQLQQNEALTMKEVRYKEQHIQEMMYQHRQLLQQYQRLKKQFGVKHAGVIRTAILIQDMEGKMAKYIPNDIIAQSCERL